MTYIWLQVCFLAHPIGGDPASRSSQGSLPLPAERTGAVIQNVYQHNSHTTRLIMHLTKYHIIHSRLIMENVFSPVAMEDVMPCNKEKK